MSLNFLDQIAHTTTRIECFSDDGNSSSGTGFFFNFCYDESGGRAVPAVITNKHVINGFEYFRLNFNQHNGDDEPIYGEHVSITLRTSEVGWVQHPEGDVDLVALPIAGIIRYFENIGKKIYLKGVERSYIRDAIALAELSATEPILMVGYPIGLWDDKNNMPIVRQGITATAPYLDFRGRPEFLIDCACFPGSSGSPIYLMNLGSHMKKDGQTVLASRVGFLGILWGGPQWNSKGALEVVPVPTANNVIVPIPTNLGFCIKAGKLLDFENHFQKLMDAQKTAKEVAKASVETQSVD